LVRLDTWINEFILNFPAFIDKYKKMSIFIAKQQKTADFLPEIRSEGDILAERETLRNSISNKANLELILSIYGKFLVMKCLMTYFRCNKIHP